MKNLSMILTRLGMVALLLAALWSCEESSETFNPVNPNLSVDNVIGTVESASRTLNGAERQLSLLVDEFATVAAIASDNYINTKTFFNQNLDNLTISTADADVRDLAYDIGRLRALTTLALEEIGPADADYNAEQQSGFTFLRGLSYLYGGMYFKTLSGDPLGVALPASAHYELAIDDFTEAIRVDPSGTYGQAALLARARANYYLGNKAEAVADANAIISDAPALLYSARFDAVAGPVNTLQDALWDRGTFDDLQPLPTLDFLDPKYNGSNSSVDMSIAIVKAEEAHLILAEAALSESRLEDAKTIMNDVVSLVATRPTATFDDRADGRDEDDPGSRPNLSTVMVSPGPGRAMESGLVLDRQAATVTVPTVSGTSYDANKIAAISSIDEGYEALYRMRQEIFIGEGIRMVDLGIKFPVSQREADANPNIVASDQDGYVPSFVFAVRDDIDGFTYDVDAGTAQVTVNMNAIIATNRSSADVAPFE